MIRKKVFLLFPLLSFVLIFFYSCSSTEEKNIMVQIKNDGYVDLSLYCKSFDEIIIYDEGYYFTYDENQWPGTKIYYLSENKVVKVINLKYCADVPWGDVIHFSDYENGMIKLDKNNFTFYLSCILKYDRGRIFQLSLEKNDTKIYSFK